MRKIMRAHGCPCAIFSVRAIEWPLTVASEELAAVAAIATSSTVAGCVAGRPLPGATSREQVSSNFRITASLLKVFFFSSADKHGELPKHSDKTVLRSVQRHVH